MQIETEKAMNSRYRNTLILLVGVWLLCACSATRDLPEDTYMLRKVKVVTDGKYKDINPTQMKTYVRQKTNSRWLSTMKVPLGIYALAGKDSSWVHRPLRQLGEAPVTYDTLMAQQTCKDLQLALQNKGYLDAEVELYVDIKKRKLDAIYVLHPGTAYHVHGLDINIRDSVIANLLKDYKNVLHDGMQFNTDALNEERSQITQFLQNQGYFRFHKEFINYRAKKDEASHQVKLAMILHPYRNNEEANDTLHSRYWIRNILYESGSPTDSVIHLREKVLKENTFIKEGIEPIHKYICCSE